MPQRIGMFAVMVFGTLLALRGIDAMGVVGGARGATLLASDSPISAIGQLVSVCAVVAIGASVVAAMGNPLAGVFTFAASLIMLAVEGGPIDEWIRLAPSSASYWTLAGESMVWLLILFIAITIIETLAARLRQRMPASWLDEDDKQRARRQSETELANGLLGNFFHSIKDLSQYSGLKPSQLLGLFGAATSVVVGLIASAIMMRSTMVNQAAWGLGVAFTLAGVVSHQLFPTSRPRGILLSPMIVAAIWYAWAAMTGGNSDVMLATLYTGNFTHGALALPIFYAASGTAGAAVGVGWSQALIASQIATQDEAEMAETTATR